MDTTWFAVDRDGNVAMFETGESGAVPSAVADEYYPGEELLDSMGDRLYRYEHTTENWISGPYERTNEPKEPVKEDAMPDDVLEHAIRFDGSFADTKELQPAELWTCESWQPGWLASDKKTVRAFEGREDELEDIEENLEGEGDELVMAEPLTGLPEATLVKSAPEGGRPPPPGAVPVPFPKFDSPERPGETDFSDVMPKSDPAAPAAKKPWWKFWA